MSSKLNEQSQDKNKPSLIPSPIYLSKGIKLYYSSDKNYISLCPILPLNKLDILFKLYDLKKLGISQSKVEQEIKSILSSKNLPKIKKIIKNGVELEQIDNNIKIIDKHFIQDCIVISKTKNNDSAYNIANRISNCIFNISISFEYLKNKNTNTKSNSVVAKIKVWEKIVLLSDPKENEKKAKFDGLIKFIEKFLPPNISKEINNNILTSIKQAEKISNEKQKRFEKYLKSCGGDRKLLKQKRKINHEEFNKRLPYFNMLNKDPKNISPLEEDDDEIFFMNTENLPINEILLGDLGIVDNHLKDFTYTPLRLFEMVRDSEKNRGIDFKIDYSQINDKNYCVNNEATIFSQKLGIKVYGYGKSKEEAGNKCALNCLCILFKKKFQTFYQLHEYFENKNGKYLDAILSEEYNENKDNNINNNIIINNDCSSNNNNNENDNNNYNNIFKKKKIGENIIEIINEEEEESENNENNYNHQTTNNIINENENLINDGISEINKSYSSNNSNTSKQLIEALSGTNTNLKNDNDNDNDNLSFSEEKKDENIFDMNLFFIPDSTGI